MVKGCGPHAARGLDFLGNQKSEGRHHAHLLTDARGRGGGGVEATAGRRAQGGSFHGTDSNGANCLPARVLTAPPQRAMIFRGRGLCPSVSLSGLSLPGPTGFIGLLPGALPRLTRLFSYSYFAQIT